MTEERTELAELDKPKHTHYWGKRLRGSDVKAERRSWPGKPAAPHRESKGWGEEERESH